LIHLLLFIGFQPTEVWHGYMSNAAAEFVNIIILTLGTLGILVLFGRWWEKQ